MSTEPNRDLDIVPPENAADVAIINTPLAKFVADCAALPRSKRGLRLDDVFVELSGEDRRLGLVTSVEPARSGYGIVHVVYENGNRASFTDGATGEVFVLGTVPSYARGKNPLRTLLNWASRFGG